MICSYCGKEHKTTREHIIPNGFLKKMNRTKMITESEAVPQRVVSTDLVIKDVCPDCNNGPLSELDAYALSLILQYNEDIKNTKERIDFIYELDKLQRWILKVSFNSARATKATYDCTLYSKNIDYILGKGKRNSYIQTYALYIDPKPLYTPKYEIDEFRIGKLRIKKEFTDSIAYRFIIINSFVFITIVAEANDKAISTVEKELKKAHFIKLNTIGRVSLKKDSCFYRKSIIDNLERKRQFLRLRTNDSRRPLIVITKEMVESKNIEVFEVLKCYCTDKDELTQYYQSVLIALEGYESEKREVYQIKEFQEYCKMVLTTVPELFWFVDLSFQPYPFIEVMFWACINDGCITDTNDSSTTFKVNFKYAAALFKQTCNSINHITNNFAYDKSRNDEITRKIIKIMLTNLQERRI